MRGGNGDCDIRCEFVTTPVLEGSHIGGSSRTGSFDRASGMRDARHCAASAHFGTRRCCKVTDSSRIFAE